MEKTALADDDVILDILENRARPPKAKPKGVIQNISTAGKRAVLAIYDEISWWTGNDARTFRETLKAVDAEVIELRINSPGGGVFEGVAIYNMLLAHPARIEVHIDGLAASIASVIAMAGEEIHISENAMLMIHNPSVYLRGESSELRKAAEVLDKIKESILNTYESVTGMDRAALSAAMDAETYYTADEAVEAGFATHKTEPMKAAASVALWSAEDFSELPEKVRLLGNKGEKSDQGSVIGDQCGETASPGAEAPVLKGTVEDVVASRALIEKMMEAYGF